MEQWFGFAALGMSFASFRNNGRLTSCGWSCALQLLLCSRLPRCSLRCGALETRPFELRF